MKFLVALDTGSDLFWVPCDCSQCASIEGKHYSSVSFCFSIENLVVNRNHACCYKSPPPCEVILWVVLYGLDLVDVDVTWLI